MDRQGSTTPALTVRRSISIHGVVQGVGFRPFVYRLARELHITGWVANDGDGVLIDAEGDPPAVEQFVARLPAERPPLASIMEIVDRPAGPLGYTSFDIRESIGGGQPTALMSPDVAICDECLRDILNPANRRFRYPFTNCTNCGPRYSIIESLPYDRPRTTMKKFTMCAACAAEYANPADRRFHAQPNACPACGPQLEFWNLSGESLALHDEALRAAAGAVMAGKIVALKGLGGFQLLADAANPDAVQTLRLRKRRPAKPFAVMVPNLEDARMICSIDDAEERLLRSPESPIVILRKIAPAGGIAEGVAPGNPTLGLMLPYTPLHQLLLRTVGSPVVATSGNISDEPICTDEFEALHRLKGIADCFLIHTRPIFRHVDDSVARIVRDRVYLLRRARGYAPRPFFVGSRERLLAVGGQMKNCVALSVDGSAFVSQHIGDLDAPEAFGAFRRTIDDLSAQYNVRPTAVIADAHPDYRSTRHATERGVPVEYVQHHYAHVASCMADNHLDGDLLGVSWDGTGYGMDGTVWGGEFIKIHGDNWTRVATLKPFRLPGGEQAIREPRRSAAGVLYAALGDDPFSEQGDDLPGAWTPGERRTLLAMIRSGINTPETTSAGRLFDAVASLCGIRQAVSFEGEAAMSLEFEAGGSIGTEAYPFALHDSIAVTPLLIVDWSDSIRAIVRDQKDRIPASIVSRRFHRTLVEMIVTVAERIGEKRVLLTGGCFQNILLLESTIFALEEKGYLPFWHRNIPPNDGGLALGQIVASLQKKGLYRTVS